MKKLWLLPSLLCLALSPARSAILVEDDFDYAVGSIQTAWNGGTGFSGTWKVASNTNGAIVSGLSFGSMAVSGNALSVNHTSTTSTLSSGNVFRTMDVGTISSGDIWMSYLYKFDTSSSPLDERFAAAAAQALACLRALPALLRTALQCGQLRGSPLP